MLIAQSWKYSGYTLFARFTRMQSVEKVDLSTFNTGVSVAGIAASIAGTLGVAVSAATNAVLALLRVASLVYTLTEPLSVETWSGTVLHIKTGGVKPSGGTEVPCCTETWSAIHKYILDASTGSSDVADGLQEVSVENVYGNSEWEYQTEQVMEKAYELYTT